MARAIGTVQTAQRIGPAVGPVIGGVLAVVGLRNAFLVSAVVYAGALLMVAFMYTEPVRAARTPGESGRVSFGTVLAFENFVLLMAVIFGLQVVDRSFTPVLLLHVLSSDTPRARLRCLSVCCSRLAVLGFRESIRSRRAARAGDDSRGHRRLIARCCRDAGGVRPGAPAIESAPSMDES
jgi:MFS family permease